MRQIFLVIGFAVFTGRLDAAEPQPPGWQVLYQQDFEHGTPPEWNLSATAGPGTGWSLKAEAGNTYLSATGHVTASLNLGPWTDFRFKVRVRMIAEGVLLNFRTAGCARYLIPFRTTGLQVGVTHSDCVSGGIVKNVAGKFALNQWYTFEIVGVGPTVDVYVDGALQLEYVDPTPLVAGSVSLECLTQADFDDVEISGPPPPAAPTWVKTGGPIGGIGYDIKMRPDNPEVMYVTDAFSGLHISSDGGSTWVASNQGITTRAGFSGDAVPIFCVTLDPNNADTVWVGTQNARGIYKSVDAGKTWEQKINGIAESGITFRGIAVDPHNSSVVYAAAEISSSQWAGHSISGREFDLTKGVVYRSTDGGGNWIAIWRGDNLARYVVIDPRDSNVLYISTGIFDREAANSDMLHGIPGGVGVVKSTDGGQNWRALNAANGLGDLYIGSLFLHPANPDILLAAAGFVGAPDQSGIYLSIDGGEHWKQGVDTRGRVIQTLITSVEFSASNPKIAYACGFEMFFRSNDGGSSWQLMAGKVGGHYGPPGIWTGFPIDLQVDPRNPDRVFINNYGGGNFLSLDGGATWAVASKGYTGATVNGISVSPSDWQRIYTIGPSGVFRSDDAGGHWQGLYNVPSTGLSEAVVAAPDRPGRVLMSNWATGTIWRSNDDGVSWTSVFQRPGIPAGPTNRHGFHSIVFAPSDPRVVYAGMRYESSMVGNGPSFGVYKSLDGGETWQEANDKVSANQSINILAVDPKNPAAVYAGTTQGGLLRTRDGAGSWSAVNQGLPSMSVHSVAIDPADSTILYAGMENDGLLKSIDGGDHWQRSGAGMSSQAVVFSIVIDPASPQTVYAADLRTGVYRSQDAGKVWYQIDGGLRTRAVQAMSISSDGGTLYAATQGEGVFRLDLKPGSESALSAISAASFVKDGPLAAASIVSLYGPGLAAALATAGSGTLPTTLGETQVSVIDADGTDFQAQLYFVSAGQINFLVPAGVQPGAALVRVFRQNKVVARRTVQVDAVAPGIFTANADGKGAPAALAARYGAGGAQTAAPVFQCGLAPGSCAAVAMDVGAVGDQLILMLYGTGIRGARGVTATIGGVDATVLGFAAQSQYPGLDQVNVLVPRELKGRGDVDVVLKGDGKSANAVRIRIL